MLNLDASQILIQIIGFLGMLWVLKKYGWKPLLDILEARREKIQAEFDSIAAQKEEVNRLAAQYDEKLKGIEADTRKKVQEAVEAAHKIGIEIQEDAQARAREILQQVKAEVEGEVAKAKNQLKNDMVGIIVGVTNKILQEDLDAASQKKLIANFVEEAQLK